MSLKKFFSSSNKNAPQLSNTLGCLIPVLDYALCNGSTPEAVASIYENNGYLTITTLMSNGYQAHQTVSFSGVLNGECIIHEIIDGQRFKIKKLVDDVNTYNGVVANTSCKLNALGFNKAFSGVNKAVYQSMDLSEACRPYLRVDDGSVEGYSDSWVKAAMVGMLEECSGIDDFNSGYGHQPLGLSYQENWKAYTPNGWGSGTGKSKGYLRWFYSASANQSNNYWYENSGGANGNSPWVIIGGSRSFILLVQKSHFRQSCWTPYAFGVLDDATEDVYKGFVLGCTARTDRNTNYAEDNITQRWNSGGVSGAALVMRPFSGNSPSHNSPLSFYIPTKQSFISGSGALLPVSNDKFLTLKNIAYDSDGVVRGTLPCIESLGTSYNSNTHGNLNIFNQYEAIGNKNMVGFLFEYVESRLQTRVGFVNLGEYDA